MTLKRDPITEVAIAELMLQVLLEVTKDKKLYPSAIIEKFNNIWTKTGRKYEHVSR